MSPRYSSPAAFRAAMEIRLKAAATDAGRPVNELRRQYLTQRFLARVYAMPDPEWILLGGTALLARIPGARHSKDVDFIHPHELSIAVAALTDLVSAEPAPDPFTFDIATTAAPPRDNHLSLKVTARLSVTVVEIFSVDITRRILVATLDTVQPEPVIDIEDVDELPPFLTIPLAQQVADKLCAMYETHGASGLPSSRFRDLVDLMIIITLRGEAGLTASAVTDALTAEQARRALTIPPDLPIPSLRWATGYTKMARAVLPRTLHRLEPALQRLQEFAGPILTGVAAGTWQSVRHSWSGSEFAPTDASIPD
jgi:hypothetical protein